jgi:hypothetical protein
VKSTNRLPISAAIIVPFSSNFYWILLCGGKATLLHGSRHIARRVEQF